MTHGGHAFIPASRAGRAGASPPAASCCWLTAHRGLRPAHGSSWDASASAVLGAGPCPSSAHSPLVLSLGTLTGVAGTWDKGPT